MKTLKFSDISFCGIPFRVDWHEKTTESTAIHAHEFFEMTVLVAGEGIQEIGSESFMMRPGDVFLIPPFVPHTYRKRRNAEMINFIIDQSCVHSWEPSLFSGSCNSLFQICDDEFQVGHIHLNGDIRGKIINDFHLIARYQSEKMPAKKLACFSIFFQLCWSLAKFEEETPSCENSAEKLASKIAIHMEKCYKQDLSISLIAKRNGISIRTLQRIFRDTFQCSPLAFLNKIRLDKSTNMLSHTSLNISEIAEESGFHDSNYYCKIFTKEFGIPPRKYRIDAQKELPI